MMTLAEAVERAAALIAEQLEKRYLELEFQMLADGCSF